MRRTRQVLGTVMLISVLFGVALWGSAPVLANADGTPSLVISQVKITSSNGQFVTLYNATGDPLDASEYQLEYFNNYDLSKATSSRVIGLSGMIPPHGYLMVNDSAMQLCFQLLLNSASLGFSSTAGMITVLAIEQTNAGGPVESDLQDYFAWSKTAAKNVQALPSSPEASLMREPRDDNSNPDIDEAGSGSWQSVQPDSQNACKFVTMEPTPSPVQPGVSRLLPASEPPVTFLAAATTLQARGSNNNGLMKPLLTELMPNPAGTGNDRSQEFIEIYNPNSKSFGLTGYSLQSGLKRLYHYSFPDGAVLRPKSFTVFYASKTKLSLSNTASQVAILDPSRKIIASSMVYEKAKDGQAWARANGKWFWTTVSTPGKANIINEPAQKRSTKNKSFSKYGNGYVNGTASGQNVSSSEASKPEDSPVPVHPRVLALVGGAALLYGAYEYRADLANKLHQFRSHLGARRGGR